MYTWVTLDMNPTITYKIEPLGNYHHKFEDSPFKYSIYNYEEGKFSDLKNYISKLI